MIRAFLIAVCLSLVFASQALAAAPVNTSLPQISGTLQDGQTLTASPGTWTNSPTRYGYDWRSCNASGLQCVRIARGPTVTTYKLTSAEVGKTIQVVVTATNASGQTNAFSPHTGVVAAAASCPVPQPQTTWAPVGRAPLTDAQAAACVQHVAELRTGNQPYTSYVPTANEEQAWKAAQPNNEHEPDIAQVDGLDGLSNPSTDDLIQWATYKWGIPTDWIRAEAMQESHWDHTVGGDLISVSAADYPSYPALAHASGASCSANCQVWRSLGLMQIGWTTATNIPGYGTEPLRWKSLAFNVDYQGAELRWYYNGHCSWCSPGYSAGQQWPSIGAWFEPSPWNNSAAQSYVAGVQTHLANRDWPHS